MRLTLVEARAGRGWVGGFSVPALFPPFCSLPFRCRRCSCYDNLGLPWRWKGSTFTLGRSPAFTLWTIFSAESLTLVLFVEADSVYSLFLLLVYPFTAPYYIGT
jgi:hypothetical protein